MLIIEELDMFTKGHYLPDDINALVQVGRHRAISLIGVSRNPASLPKQFLAQCNLRVSFKQTEPRHLKALEEYGFDVNLIPGLNVGQFTTVGDSRLLIRKKEKNEPVDS